MDPLLIPRFVALAFRFWIGKLGKRTFWALFSLSSLVTVGLIVAKV